MTRAKVIKLRRPSAAPPEAALAGGIHPGRIERRIDGRFMVRALGGALVSARLGEGVEEAFADECQETRRMVLISAGDDGEAVILGALQTSSAVLRDEGDKVRLAGRHVSIEAEEGVAIQVGQSKLRLDRHGAVKIAGAKLTMDIAAVVRVLSSLVELP